MKGTPGQGSRRSGFTLLSVLIAMVILSIGLLAIARTTVNVTGAQTQNENVQAMATISNGFWGVVQANPQLLTSGLPATYNASSAAVSSAALQTWLNQTTAALPNAQIAIATWPDPTTGLACGSGPVGTNCTVVLTLQWDQVATTGIPAGTRTQTFYYEF